MESLQSGAKKRDGGADEEQLRVVVAAVLERGGHFLVGLRPPEKRHGGMWEFPGGKLDPGESIEDAVRRELREELALEIEGIDAPLLVVKDEGSEFSIHFVLTQASGTPIPLEHTALRWCSPEELSEMPLAPSDARFVARCLLNRPSDTD